MATNTTTTVIVAALDRLRDLEMRIAAARIAAADAEATFKEAERAAGDATVAGNAEAMEATDAQADAAHDALRRQRRNLDALERARITTATELRTAVQTGREVLETDTSAQMQAIAARYHKVIQAAFVCVTEATALALATGHHARDHLLRMRLPADLTGADELSVGFSNPQPAKSAGPALELMTAIRQATRTLEDMTPMSAKAAEPVARAA
jgi:hypothetical protein